MAKNTPYGYWTLERCKESALEYETRSEWQKKQSGAYGAARRKGWVDECCAHMVSVKKPHGYWTKERVVASAKPYKTIKEWKTNEATAHTTACANGWLRECQSHMIKARRPSGHWTRDTVMANASGYEYSSVWKSENHGAYFAACQNGWLDDCTKHMVPKVTTKEFIIEYSKRFDAVSDWVDKSPNTYKSAQYFGVLKDCTSRMTKKKRSNRYWTRERCAEIAREYKRPVDWQKGHGTSYVAAMKNGWTEYCQQHMDFKRPKRRGYWTLEKCAEDAKQYDTRYAWCSAGGGGYAYACKNEWLDICCSHMKRIIPTPDTVYIWAAKGELYNGNGVVKIGITHHGNHKKRIKQTARYNNQEAEILIVRRVGLNVREVEKELLSIGDDPKYAVKDGRTEFRAMSQSQLTKAISIIEDAR